ncbi:site-2 protease family protein [Nocardiopsis ansamitocini]|uniref:Site-2 protease family protein n=1 Tax=Nocardiopsis ansamitocini TaxID=1670832 RepID=A0A9W6UHJ5_9ACTN|nr:site-2 protease family protein [Nocardiopsis ansamitocini]GLU46802.1 hypothetical protein Nans01_11530 [Nocardiopsis ansamitocini]
MSTPEPDQPREPDEQGPAGQPARAGTVSLSPPSRFDFVPSPVFASLLLLAAAAGWLSWTRLEGEYLDGQTSYAAFALILIGWVICLALHEFAHGLAAYLLGDRSLRSSAYLRLNPLKFKELFAGLILPLVFLFLARVGMTGPPVYLDPDAVPGRAKRTVIALSGPAANAVLVLVLTVVLKTLVPGGAITNNWVLDALVFLCFLNITALVLNLLPVPGTDVFAAIAPHIPGTWVRDNARALGIFGSVAIFAVLSLPPLRAGILELMGAVFEVVTGLSGNYVLGGATLFFIWG